MAEFQRMDALAKTSLILGESPLKPPLPHAFTSANAAEMARRANAAKRARIAALEADSVALRNVTPQSERLANRLEQLERLMDGETDGDAWNKLSSSYAKIFSAWQVLTGTPNPGSRRVKASRPSSSSVETVQVVSDSGTQ